MADMKNIPGTPAWISAKGKGGTTTPTDSNPVESVVVKEEGKTNPVEVKQQ